MRVLKPNNKLTLKNLLCCCSFAKPCWTLLPQAPLFSTFPEFAQEPTTQPAKLECYHFPCAPQSNPIPLSPLFRSNHCAESFIIPLLLRDNFATCTNQYTICLLVQLYIEVAL